MYTNKMSTNDLRNLFMWQKKGTIVTVYATSWMSKNYQDILLLDWIGKIKKQAYCKSNQSLQLRRRGVRFCFIRQVAIKIFGRRFQIASAKLERDSRRDSLLILRVHFGSAHLPCPCRYSFALKKAVLSDPSIIHAEWKRSAYAANKTHVVR